MRKRIIHGVTYVVGSKVARLLLSLVITPILVRVLGSDGYGNFAFIMSIFSIVVIFTSTMIFTGVRKFISENNYDDMWITNLLLLFIFIGSLATILISILILVFIRSGALSQFLQESTTTYFYILILMLPAHQIVNLGRSGLMGIGLEKYSEPLRILERLTFGVSAVGLAYIGYGVSGALFGRSLAYLTAGSIGLAYLYRHVDIPDEISFELPIKRILMYNFQTIPLVLLITSIDQADIIILRLLTSSTETGYYRAALSITVFFYFVPESVQTVLLHSSSELWSENNIQEIEKIMNTVIKYTLLISLLLVIGLSALARPFITIYYGVNFYPSVTPLLLLLPGTLGFALARPIYSVGQGKGELLPLISATALSAGLNIILNLLLIPQYGLQGAAIATSVGYGSMFVFHTVAAIRIGFNPICEITKNKTLKNIVIIFSLTSIAAHILNNLVENMYVSLIIIPPVVTVIYVYLIIYLNVITIDEIRALISEVISY